VLVTHGHPDHCADLPPEPALAAAAKTYGGELAVATGGLTLEL
jgi:glyoxylase-like metal-dependent hydrolase (beta-lactamase superfamily II)